MKVLVIGSKGMLGAEFVRQIQLRDRDEVVLWGREDFDITNAQEGVEKISLLKPALILNCAAYNNVDKAEDEPEVANAINGEAVGYLARAAAKCDATFVHFSTDYVFGGDAQDGYYEEDIPNPISAYGHSKALGEQRLLSIFCHSERSSSEAEESHMMQGVRSLHSARASVEMTNKWYIVRTSKLFGPPGTGATSKKSFPEMMLGFARSKGRIEAIDGEAGSPTYIYDLAKSVLAMVEGHATSGIYHIVNTGACTWYEYAKAAVEFAGVHAEVVPVGPERFPRKAKRPARIVLINTKLPPLRPWQEALKEFLSVAQK